MTSSIDIRNPKMSRLFDEVVVEEVQAGFLFLEGPVWIAARSELIFSDMANDQLHKLGPDHVISEYRRPANKPNGGTLDNQGRLLTCEHATSRVVREEPDGQLTVLATHYADRELNSPNDIIVAPDGTIMFTDPTFGREEFFGIPRPESQDERAVYAIDAASGEVRRICGGFGQPNGLCLSNDARYLYVNDTQHSHIKRYRWSDGQASDEIILTEVTGDGPGSPDGMKVDRYGNIFCTGPGGLHVYGAEGDLLGIVRTATGLANFTWGDDDLMSLYLCGGDRLYRVRTLQAGPALPRTYTGNDHA